ncbi:hypothetical protein OKW50_001845 [Paraburkholderia youngii]|uniref:hypothetical protein n=1 Tax=Paraburkholderia youngii TaxID=2782701 RepID=UPI0015906E5C|nr:hypothetical protein [Paraburkholderia youngii]NUX56147.1 hypothetical protein [Paraburkholderia youngii]
MRTLLPQIMPAAPETSAGDAEKARGVGLPLKLAIFVHVSLYTAPAPFEIVRAAQSMFASGRYYCATPMAATGRH